jgi:hypothetical protein
VLRLFYIFRWGLQLLKILLRIVNCTPIFFAGLQKFEITLESLFKVTLSDMQIR